MMRDANASGVRGQESIHALLFRQLLRLYPVSFRDAYGVEMTRFFLARVARVRGDGGGRSAMVRLWLRIAFDIARTAAMERRGLSARTNDPRKGDGPMSTLLQDLRYAARRLRMTPLFTVSAIAILAVGIGLNAAVFSLMDAMLFRPAPFVDREEIVHVYQDSDEGEPSSTSYPAYRDMAAMTDIFAGVGATSSGTAMWETADGARPVSIEFATASYFPVLGLEPHRGRWFAAQHDHVGEEMAAVVSHRAWRTQMGADPNVVGRTIRLNNQPVTIIGVGPESFNGDAGALITDFWVSISGTPVGGEFRVANLERREDHWYQVKARLAHGVTVERAQSAMDGLAGRLAEAWPQLNEGRGITVFGHDGVRFHPEVDGTLRSAGFGLFVVAGLVLLLACSNLANLLLVRGVARGPELAVRQALGAGRGRVVRLLLLEALLLAGLGGVAGLALASWAVRFLPLLPLPIPGLDVGFDHRLVIFGMLLATATGLLFGGIPAVRTARTDVAAVLRDEERGQSAGRTVSVLRGGLVAIQVAVSVVLVIGAGLLARSLANAERVDPGVDAGRIAVLGTNLQQTGVSDGAAATLVADLLERIDAVPGVEQAALTTRLPVQGGGTTTQVVEDYRPPSGTGAVELPWALVSRGYFETMGIPVLEGRAFSIADSPDAPRLVIVNETAARLFWGGNAVGGRIRPAGNDTAWRRVVGVVADTKVANLQESPTPMIYYSAEQAGVVAFNLVARTSGDPAALTSALRTALREVHPALPVTRLVPLEAHFGDALAASRATAALMGGFSILALLLASLGVYAVISFSVERRSRELGIRMALGAASSSIIGMVVAETLAIVAAGVAAGIVLALLATRALEGVLFGVGTVDGITFAGAAALLLLAAVAAALAPALRAARADPLLALRR
jgi:predicted permease